MFKKFILLLLSCSAFASDFTSMPKVELHLHLSGSYPLEYVYSIATPKQKEALEKELARISKSVPIHECFDVFGLVSQIVNTVEKVEEGVVALCRDLEADGVIYAEIRTGLKNFGLGYEEYLKAVLRGIQRGSSDRLEVRLILSLQRNATPAYVQATTSLALKYRDRGVVGLDISGESTVGDIQQILPDLIAAKREGLFVTLHIGESPLETGQRELLEALQPDRIGHGVYLKPDALFWVLVHNIPIEICLSSGELVQMIGPQLFHPALGFLLQQHPAIICSDDPLIFNTSLSNEYSRLQKTLVLTYGEVELYALRAIDYTFLPDSEKAALKKRAKEIAMH
jgi:adenosine deaminase